MDYKRTFLDLLLRHGALKIADRPAAFFRLKSGRRSPSFVSLGALTDGRSLAALKDCYAAAALDGVRRGVLRDFGYVFGPAYKGIPLAVLTCQGVYARAGESPRLLYDRKEEKAHGEATSDDAAGRLIVGAEHFTAGGAILLVDDVVTTGQAKYDALAKIKLLGEHVIAGLLVAVDRQERLGDADRVEPRSATQALEHDLGIPTFAILTMQNIFGLVQETLSAEVRRAWVEYYERYGAVRLG